MSKDLKQQKAAWEETTLAKTLNRFPERKEYFSTSSDIELERVYLPEDVGEAAEARYTEQLGFPGAFPYTRGVQPTMYRGRFWTMRQYAGYATAEESNARYRYLLGAGQTGLSVAFDLPTQIGYDSDDPMALGEVGKVGVSIPSLRDMERLFEGIPLDKVSTSMTINAPAAILLAMYIAVGKKQGVEPAKLRGDGSERYFEGIHRARNVHLPAETVDAPDHGSVRVLREGSAALEHDQHQRVSHSRGGIDGGAGSRVHAGGRDRLRAGCDRCGAGRGWVRAAAQFLLQRAQ